jgi:hypothetical protein
MLPAVPTLSAEIITGVVAPVGVPEYIANVPAAGIWVPLPKVNEIVFEGLAVFQAAIKAFMLEVPSAVKTTEFPLTPMLVAVIVTLVVIPVIAPVNDAGVPVLEVKVSIGPFTEVVICVVAFAPVTRGVRKFGIVPEAHERT